MGRFLPTRLGSRVRHAVYTYAILFDIEQLKLNDEALKSHNRVVSKIDLYTHR